MELGHPGSLADDTERVNVAVADVGPVVEPDTELEGGLRGRHELALIDFHQAVKALHRRDGRLAHSDGADEVGLHERDLQLTAEAFDEAERSQPARGAATGDDDTSFA